MYALYIRELQRMRNALIVIPIFIEQYNENVLRLPVDDNVNSYFNSHTFTQHRSRKITQCNNKYITNDRLHLKLICMRRRSICVKLAVSEAAHANILLK